MLILLFLVLSLADLLLTLGLIYRYNLDIELNPIARESYRLFEWAGLVLLKFSTVGVVLWVGKGLTAMGNKAYADFVLAFGIAATLVATILGVLSYVQV